MLALSGFRQISELGIGSLAFLNVIDGSTVELSSLLSALYASNVVNIGVIICKTNLPVSFEDRE